MSKLPKTTFDKAAKAECVNRGELTAVLATKDSGAIAKHLAPLVQEGSVLSKDEEAQKAYVNALIGLGDVETLTLHLRPLVSAGGEFENNFGLLARFCQALFIEGKKTDALYHGAALIADPGRVGRSAHIKGLGLVLALSSSDQEVIAEVENDVKAASGKLIFEKAQRMAQWLREQHAIYIEKNPTHAVRSGANGLGFKSASEAMTDVHKWRPITRKDGEMAGLRRFSYPQTKTRGGFPPRATLHLKK